MPASVEERPQRVVLAAGTTQEVVGFALSGLVEFKHCERLPRWSGRNTGLAATTRSTCTTDMTAHRVLLFASDQLSQGGGLTRAMGSRFAPGAFLLLGLVAHGLCTQVAEICE